MRGFFCFCHFKRQLLLHNLGIISSCKIQRKEINYPFISLVSFVLGFSIAKDYLLFDRVIIPILKNSNVSRCDCKLIAILLDIVRKPEHRTHFGIVKLKFHSSVTA